MEKWSEQMLRSSSSFRKCVLRVIVNCLILAQQVLATPSIALPINSQVPPVARVGEPFDFVFAPDTFSASSTNISYALSEAPRWLRLDGPKRHLTGIPVEADVGAVTFYLVATDESGQSSMFVILVILDSLGPGLGTPVSEQLSLFGPSSGLDGTCASEMTLGNLHESG